MEIVFDRNTTHVQQRARDFLYALLRRHTSTPVLLLLSGGSALDLLKGLSSDMCGDTVTIAVLDERYSKETDVNNFAQLADTQWFQDCCQSGAHSIDTRIIDGESLEGLASRFESLLKEWFTCHTNGVCIATMGIGPDGHTGGILPYSEDPELFRKLFEETDVWVRGYDAKEKNQYPLRVTTTIPFLKKIDYAIAYCVGQSKKEALTRIVSIRESHSNLPATILHSMKSVTLFTDLDTQPPNG